MLVLKDMRRLKTLEKNRAGDVIGEVAYQSDFSAKFLGKGNKVNPQYILDFNTQQILGESFAKPRSQIAVNFNRSNLTCFSIKGAVSAAWPGPISTIRSPGLGLIAAMIRAMMVGS